MAEVNSGKGYSYWLKVAEDNSLLPSHNCYSAVSILHVTQQFLVATSIKSSATAVKPVSNLHTREPGSEATISTANHFPACTFYCSLAFISAKYT